MTTEQPKFDELTTKQPQPDFTPEQRSTLLFVEQAHRGARPSASTSERSAFVISSILNAAICIVHVLMGVAKELPPDAHDGLAAFALLRATDPADVENIVHQMGIITKREGASDDEVE